MKNVAYLSSLMNSRISCSSLSSIIRSLDGQRLGEERRGREGEGEDKTDQTFEWERRIEPANKQIKDTAAPNCLRNSATDAIHRVIKPGSTARFQKSHANWQPVNTKK